MEERMNEVERAETTQTSEPVSEPTSSEGATPEEQETTTVQTETTTPESTSVFDAELAQLRAEQAALAQQLASLQDELAQKQAQLEAYEEVIGSELGDAAQQYKQAVESRLLQAELKRLREEQERLRQEQAKRVAAEHLAAQTGGLVKPEQLLEAKDPVEMAAKAVELMSKELAKAKSTQKKPKPQSPEADKFIQPKPSAPTPTDPVKLAREFSGKRRGSLEFLKALREANKTSPTSKV